MAEQAITLEPGESKVVSFEVTPSTAKTYSVSVDGLTGSFRATSPVLEFDNILIYGINGQKFSSVGTDPDGVRFGVLKNKLSVPNLSGLKVNWQNKTVAFGDQIVDAGFIVSFLNPGGTAQIQDAPVYWGLSGVPYKPQNPFDATAILANPLGYGYWHKQSYDAFFEFGIRYWDQGMIMTIKPSFRVRNLLTCTSEGNNIPPGWY